MKRLEKYIYNKQEYENQGLLFVTKQNINDKSHFSNFALLKSISIKAIKLIICRLMHPFSVMTFHKAVLLINRNLPD